MNICKYFSKVLEKIASYFSIVGLLVVASIMLLQVILRYIFKSGLPWGEEIMRYTMVWITVLTGSVLIKNNELIQVDFFDCLWPKKLIKYRDTIYQTFFIFTFFFIIKEGFIQAVDALDTNIISLKISWFWAYLAIPIGGIMMALQLMFYIILVNFNKKNTDVNFKNKEK